MNRAYRVYFALFFPMTAVAGNDLELAFRSHLEAGLVEQHVYVQRDPGSDRVYRVTPLDQHRYLESQVYATTEFVANAPHTHSAVGPHRRGAALGFTLGEWLAGTGMVHYRCENEVSRVEAQFENLVPNGVYTMWYSIVPRPPVEPFAALSLPVGARDGSQATFHADEAGGAEFEASFSACLQFSGSQVNTLFAIAWHSDGKTYGASPGPFSTVSHVQLISEPFPIED